MLSFGYIASNSPTFNFWKMALLGVFLVTFLVQFNFGKPHLMVMLVSFVVGYMLPYAYVLRGMSDAISDFINAIRYKDAYEDIKRKEEEVENLRRQYEEAQRRSSQEQRDQQSKRRQEQSRQYRENQQQENTGSSHQEKEKQRDQHNTSSGSTSTKARYLMVMGLDPNKQYSYKEIKKAYQRQAMKYHPDRNQGKSEAEIKNMTKKFQVVQEAYEWLGMNNE